MPSTDIKRPNYYEGQYLGAQDLVADQEYQRQQDQRHRLAAHTWGIAAGFEIEEVQQPGGNGSVDVFIHAGYAVDGFGRAVINLQRYKLPPGRFAHFLPKAGTPKQLIPVWLRYREVKTAPAKSGFEICSDQEQMNRLIETFSIEVGDLPLSQKLDALSIEGAAVSAKDGTTGELFRSVPYQALTDPGDQQRWFILLGMVSWSGTQFVPSDNPATLAFGRPYIGIIAETVLAPAGRLRIRDRTKPAPDGKLETPELAGIEGSLRVDGASHFRDLVITDSYLNIDSQNQNSGNPAPNRGLGGPALTFGLFSFEGIASQRTGPGNLNGLDFYAKNEARLSITNDGNVGIGIRLPTSKLQVVGDVTLTGKLGVGTTAPTHRFHVFAPNADGGAVGLFQSATAQAFLRLSTNEGDGKRAEITNRSGGRLSLWVNNADVLNITQEHRVGIGTINPSKSLEVIGDLQVTGGNIFVGKTQIPIHTPVDVVLGQKVFTAGELKGNGNGTVSVSVPSRLPSASSATVMVALSDISNFDVATHARWKVATSGQVNVGNNGTNATGQFDVLWQINDDGEIRSFQFVVVFVP